MTVADPRLRKALSRATGELTPEGLAKVTRLEWSEYEAEADRRWKPVEGLAGLEGCAALEYVGLVGNRVRDLAPLAPLAQLTEVWLQRNELGGDLRAFGAHPRLRVLQLSGNRLSALDGVEGCPALAELGVDANQLASLAPLAGLARLEKLRADRNLVADVAPLAGLAALRALWLSDNPLADVAPLAALTGLATLHLADTRVDDLGPLLALPRLEEVVVRGTPGASTPAGRAVVEALLARGVRVDGERRAGADAGWVVTPVALVRFAPRG
ncbi:MAG: hypothetical protein U0324_06880 [Polyangiales bacterium]